MSLSIKIAKASRSREIFLAFENTVLFNDPPEVQDRCQQLPGRSLDTFSHTILVVKVISALTTRREACHWILSRLRLPTARISATHDGLRVADAPSNHVRCCDSSSLATGRNDEFREKIIPRKLCSCQMNSISTPSFRAVVSVEMIENRKNSM